MLSGDDYTRKKRRPASAYKHRKHCTGPHPLHAPLSRCGSAMFSAATTCPEVFCITHNPLDTFTSELGLTARCALGTVERRRKVLINWISPAHSDVSCGNGKGGFLVLLGHLCCKLNPKRMLVFIQAEELRCAQERPWAVQLGPRVSTCFQEFSF